MKKRSFFERLTGSVNIDEDDFLQDEVEEADEPREIRRTMQPGASSWLDEQAGEGELSVDVFQTPDEIVVKALIPGVRKDDVDISISRDSITIRGSRKDERTISDDNYIVQELYWGTFSRTVRLPHEVDIEHADATESQGVLTVKLPRIDKDRQTKLKVKSV